MNEKRKIYPVEQIERLMLGRWEQLLSQFWNAQAFNGKHQACPVCGGKDRFRWGGVKSDASHRQKGAAICNQCGSHNGLWWFMAASGADFPTALQDIGENFLRVEPDATQLPERVAPSERAPRIQCDDLDDPWVVKYIRRVESAPGYDDAFFEARLLIEALRRKNIN